MLDFLDIFIISLKNSSRHAYCQSMVENPPQNYYSLDFRSHIFDAIDKHSCYFQKDLGYTGFIENSYSPQKLKYSSWFLSKEGREMIPEELGCYASHYFLWLKCITLNKPIVVLEDDAELLPNFYQSCIDCLNNPFDFVRLYTRFEKPEESAILGTKGTEIVPNPNSETILNKYFYLTHLDIRTTLAYYITPKAAKAFISASQFFIEPVDMFLLESHRHKIPCFTYIPMSVFCYQDYTKSTIITPENIAILSALSQKQQRGFLKNYRVALWTRIANFRRWCYYRYFLKKLGV
ncbi:glycosyltransferase family 25 protein [Helicobacter suis]|uniref:glycosyltransferase family 25 protein n=1 Tax=Helicobacter suis TaxID=104628 RepID=UPI0013D78361|nr:glycosyltransferase family 25 protein [Helicobacter suis]